MAKRRLFIKETNMIKKIKNLYILVLEKYLLNCCIKKLKYLNIDKKKIKNLSSIEKHVIDLNEKDTFAINKEEWFKRDKNKYRLLSNIYRFFQTKKIIEDYIDINNQTVVDFGAGNGVFLEFLNLKGTGVDINQGCVDEMNAKGIKAYTLEKFSDEFEQKFDHAFAFEVVEHVENQLSVLNGSLNVSLLRYMQN